MSDLAGVEVVFLSADSAREELVTALLGVNREARRELRYDNLGRPNQRWADLHEFMNELLHMIAETDEG